MAPDANEDNPMLSLLLAAAMEETVAPKKFIVLILMGVAD